MSPKKAYTYLVLENRTPRRAMGNVTVVRATQDRPYLDQNERAVRVCLNLPDGFFNDPAVEVEVNVEPIVPPEAKAVED